MTKLACHRTMLSCLSLHQIRPCHFFLFFLRQCCMIFLKHPRQPDTLSSLIPQFSLIAPGYDTSVFSANSIAPGYALNRFYLHSSIYSNITLFFNNLLRVVTCPQLSGISQQIVLLWIIFCIALPILSVTWNIFISFLSCSMAHTKH